MWPTIVVDELDETVEPHVLDETPTVLSVGRRCMKMGYAFHWMPGKLPFMVTPKQGFVHLQVKDDIPYLVSDGKLRSNRHRPTIDDLKEHFSEVLAMVTNDEANQGGDDENDITPAAVGESAEAEGEHHDGAFDFGPPGGAGPVRPPPVAEEMPVDVGSVPHRHGEAEAHEEEVDEDDPDAGIEVDVYEGSSIKRKVGVLKKDANSIAHLLTHRYRNPFCESCVKAKMRHFRSRTGAFKREVKTFGDLVTFDFVTASGDHEVEGRYALIIRDIYTGVIMAYPTARRDTDSVVRAIKHFCGRRKIKQVYSDDGPELINACVELKLNHDLSLPGRPQNNSLAERTNQFIIDQTSACLVHAGLPTCYWVQAITRPYPVGKDGFRLMKTSRPPEFTPEEWKMMSKYYTKEEKAEVKGGGKRKEEDPKSKESEISAPAEARTLQMPSGKRIRAMLRNRWGGIEWQYNWGLRKNISKIKNPMDGKHLAELEWVRIVVNHETKRSA